MSSIRLLIAVSLICSASAFAQVQNAVTSATQSPAVENLSAIPATSSATQNPSPFKIDQLSDPFLLGRNDTQAMFELFPQPRKGDVTLKGNGGEITMNPVPDARVARSRPEDSLCFAIRSYVVARDSKHSDSVHPVGYTTCVPASRYQLRTTEKHQAPERDLQLIQR